jgi:hypothetical protein
VLLSCRPSDPHDKIRELTPDSNLSLALQTAQRGETILLSAGTYAVDNPLLIEGSGMTIRGPSESRATLSPLHAWRPLIIVAANEVSIEGLVLRGLTVDSQRVTQAILISSRCKGCVIARNVIVGSGATAIYGLRLVDLRIAGNEILDSGNDALFVGGRRLSISNNVVVRFNDEAIDVSQDGDDVTIQGNCVAYGRIGIATDAKLGRIIDNWVEHTFSEGIAFFSPDGKAVVRDNQVAHTRVGFMLDRPMTVTNNEVWEASGSAFRIRNESGGLIEFGGMSDGPMPDSGCLGRLSNDALKEYEASLLQRVLDPVTATGASLDDSVSASAVARLLDNINPGVLNLTVTGKIMSSETTEHLAMILSTSAPDAVGLVRAPMILFAGKCGDQDAEWILRLHGVPHTRVTRTCSAPGVSVEAVGGAPRVDIRQD